MAVDAEDCLLWWFVAVEHVNRLLQGFWPMAYDVKQQSAQQGTCTLQKVPDLEKQHTRTMQKDRIIRQQKLKADR